MAKREVPEINAGSMADIAFLLLIFFLVTTTMDKDRAFIRKIPKKVEVENQPPPIEKRNICAIKTNNLNQIMFRRDGIVRDFDEISDKIIEFYSKNQVKNDPTNNFPMYSRITLGEIDAEIDKLDKEVTELESQSNIEPSFIEYRLTQLKDWEKRKKSLVLYGKPNLPEVAPEAHIRVEVQEKTNYELMAKIHTEIQEAEFEMKDAEAMELWGESYASMKKLADAEPGKHPEIEARLDLLGYLYSFKIVEVAPK